MKIRVVSSREEIFTLNPNERIVHLAFRPSNKDVFGLVETCPKIEVIQLPKSYMATVSRSIEMFLEMQRVQLFEGDVWGHRKDINEYYTLTMSHYQMKTSSLDHIKPNTLFAAKSMTANGVTV